MIKIYARTWRRTLEPQLAILRRHPGLIDTDVELRHWVGPDGLVIPDGGDPSRRRIERFADRSESRALHSQGRGRYDDGTTNEVAAVAINGDQHD
ncbi:MAG: hypothetical protein ABI134_19935 [Byssovorax sp.]